MSMNDDVMRRLNEIAGYLADPALDICFIPQAIKQRGDFCRNLRVLLRALTAYHAEPLK